jgi:hypothetical protein
MQVKRKLNGRLTEPLLWRLKIFKLNKKVIFALLITLFVQGQAFMGNFYTATLYPSEKTEDVKRILNGKNFYICSKNDSYNLVSEEKMDEQNSILIMDFIKKLSATTEKPIITYMIHDSDVLWFSIYKNGKEIFIIDNTAEYFSGGKFILTEKEDISKIFGIDKNIWKTEITKAKLEECTFADEFLMTLIKILKLPIWVEGIGYSYLAKDEDFVANLKDNGIKIEKY